MELEPALEDDDDSITSALPEVIADEVKSQEANALATIPDVVEEGVTSSSAELPLVLKG